MKITIRTEYDMGDQRVPYLILEEREVDTRGFNRMVELHDEKCGAIERNIIKELNQRND